MLATSGTTWSFCLHRFSVYFLIWSALTSGIWSVYSDSTDITIDHDTNGTIYTNDLLSLNGIPDSYQDGTLRGSVILHNGRIHTMDKRNRVVSVLGIKDGWVVYVGDSVTEAERKTSSGSGRLRKINLGQRVAVPGLIDCHNHIVLLGNRPGYHTSLENTFTVDEVLDTYRQRALGVPTGAFITTIGGFSPNQFDEARLPTLAELDSAAPNHPVFISTSFAGPATTNSRGKAFFESLAGDMSVSVAANGSITAGLENGKALLALRQQLTFDDRVRSARDAMAYAASIGVTTHLDQGAFPATHTPSDGAASEDLFAMHLPFLSLYNSNHGLIRLRINYLHDDDSTAVPGVTARLQHTYPFFGNAMVRTGGIGEFAVGMADYAGGPVFEAAAARIAEARWRLEVHSLTATDFRTQIEGFERVDAAVQGGSRGLAMEYLSRLKALGGGVNLSGWMYLSGAGAGNESNPAGPPFRTIAESGIPAGFGPDGANIAPLSPWPHAYYAVTGKNARGATINPGQTISRRKVLEMFTRDNTWFLGGQDEKLLGVLEVGRLGDVAVLSDDYFSVDEEKLKRLRSVLTVVGGVVVHNSGELHDD
ncbi:N-substituted formamide deformylase [Madurella mycetomatis]|uniref:N-substituted formamide deformylase n=1 Tax=Madurella mycetomatis TaxID=100816 RepID=A0A175W6U2_9PEZI|nr:N-substituted formamide deformylase [Madurella mycetomatis]